MSALLAGSVFAPVQYSAASENSNTNLTATISADPYYLTVTSSGSDLDIGATPGGSLVAAVDTVNVKTNNPNGYQLYLSMNSTDANSNRLYLNGSSASGKYISPTAGSFLNPQVLSDNSWGYALAESDAAAVRTKLSQTAMTNFNDTYSTAPSSDSVWAAVPVKGSEQLIKSTSGADETGVDTNVYYAAKATTAQAAGTYSGTVLYTAIADTGATTDTASVSPSEVDAATTGQSITISTSLYADASKVGTVTATVNGITCTVTALETVAGALAVTCTAPSLAAGTYDVVVSVPFYDKTYTITNGLTYKKTTQTLYELANGKNLQAMTNDMCNNAEIDTASTVNFATMTDSRDSKTYRVAKLDDGHCWMIDNLRLGNANTAITLNSSTSDVSSNFSIAASAIVNSGSTSWLGTVDAQHIYVQSNESYGNLYNWYTATAGTGTSSMSSSSATNTTDATDSVCPRGWKLPLGNQSDYSYYNLLQKAGIGNNSAGSTKIRSAPYSYTYAGLYNSGAKNQGSRGYYWSRSANTDASYAYLLYIGSSSANPQYYFNKYYGISVRCVYTG